MHSELCDAHEASSRFEDRGRVAGEHSNATERHLAQVSQTLAMAQAKLAHEKSLLAALLNALDALAD